MSRPRRDYRSAFLWKLKLLPPEGERRRGSCEWKETRGLCAALGGRLTQQGPTGRRTHFCHLFLESRLIRLEEISKRWVTGAATEKLLIWMLRGAHREFLGWGGTGGGEQAAERERACRVRSLCDVLQRLCGPRKPPKSTVVRAPSRLCSGCSALGLSTGSFRGRGLDVEFALGSCLLKSLRCIPSPRFAQVPAGVSGMVAKKLLSPRTWRSSGQGARW